MLEGSSRWGKGFGQLLWAVSRLPVLFSLQVARLSLLLLGSTAAWVGKPLQETVAFLIWAEVGVSLLGMLAVLEGKAAPQAPPDACSIGWTSRCQAPETLLGQKAKSCSFWCIIES